MKRPLAAPLACAAMCTAATILAAPDVRAAIVLGTPAKLPEPVNSDTTADWAPSISADALELYFTSIRGGGSDADIWMAKRESAIGNWNNPVNLGHDVNSTMNDSYPSISSDGLELYLMRGSSPFNVPDTDIWVSRRDSKSDPWQPGTRLSSTVNDPLFFDGQPEISADGLSLYFNSLRPGGLGEEDIWVSTRATRNDPWATPVNLGEPVNQIAIDGTPSVSADGTMLIFASDRPGTMGVFDLWLSTRTSAEDAWGDPENLGPIVNATLYQVSPSISSDGATLYYTAGPGLDARLDIWEVPISIVLPTLGDTDDDGDVDIDDLNNVRNNFGGNGLGDTDSDGDVDIDDLNAVRNHFGASGATAPAQSVPEPGGALLAMLAAALCATVCRRRRLRAESGVWRAAV